MHVKIYLYDTLGMQREVRRLNLPREVSWEGLQLTLAKIVNKKNFTIEYKDVDDDMVALCTSSEWEECIRLGELFPTATHPLRLHVKWNHPRHVATPDGSDVTKKAKKLLGKKLDCKKPSTWNHGQSISHSMLLTPDFLYSETGLPKIPETRLSGMILQLIVLELAHKVTPAKKCCFVQNFPNVFGDDKMHWSLGAWNCLIVLSLCVFA